MAANTLTGLAESIYAGLDTVSREQVGFIPAVRKDVSLEQAAVGQTITYSQVPELAAGNIAAGAYAPDPAGIVVAAPTMTIDKARVVAVGWTGEEQTSLGGKYQDIRANAFAQAFRTLANEVETDIAATYKSASRAYGVAGSTPFGTASDLSDIAYIREILEANGAPAGDLHLIMDTKAGAAMRAKQGIVFKANEGSAASQASGNLIQLEGLYLGQSGKIATHVAGTGTGYQWGTSGTAGDSTITVSAAGGSGTILAGDIVSDTSGSTNKYVVSTTLAGVSLAIGKPGLLNSVAVGTSLVNGTSNYKANLAFNRNAIVLANRLPKRPIEGDNAIDVMIVTDPVSGLSFEIAMYRQYRQVRYEVSLCWGVKAVKPEHMAILLG
jgi:hypothetical protein